MSKRHVLSYVLSVIDLERAINIMSDYDCLNSTTKFKNDIKILQKEVDEINLNFVKETVDSIKKERSLA